MSEPVASGSLSPFWENLLTILRRQGPGEWLILLRANQHSLWEQGQRIPAESYLTYLAVLPLDDETSIDLIYSEVLLRAERGESPTHEEYSVRFPQYAEALRQQFELFQAMQQCSALDGQEHDQDTLPPDSVNANEGDAATLDRPPSREDGTPFAPPGYTLIDLLGWGGMGVVHLARQHGLNRLVALKMIRRDDLDDGTARVRFRREAATAALLNHPNIVQVYEVGEWIADSSQPPMPFISLEYCNGGSLAAHIKEHTLLPREAAQLVETLARAVQYAHTRGVIHRDLKPGNVLLQKADIRRPNSEPDGLVVISDSGLRIADFLPKVSDFGLATHFAMMEDSSRSRVITGTPGYMAPEQIGEGEIGPAADVHGLGAILYELLGGKPPYQGNNVLSTLEAVRFIEPKPPSSLRAAVHRDLDTICLKCLQKDPNARYPSAGELAEELRRFLNGEPIHARPIGKLERSWRWSRRHPARAALVAVSILAILTFAVGGLFSLTYIAHADAQAEAQKVQREAAEEAERAQHYIALIQQIREGERRRSVGWTETAMEQLKRASSLATRVRNPVELRTEAALVLSGLDLRRECTHTQCSLAGAMAFHPDCKRLAVAHLKAAGWIFGAVQLIDLEDASRTQTFSVFPDANWTAANGVQDGVRSLAISAEGRWLLAGTRSGWVYRWDLNCPAARARTWRADESAIEGLALSKDSSVLFAFSRESGMLGRWDIAGTPRRSAMVKMDSPLLDAVLSPTGDALACCRHGRIAVLNPDDLTSLVPDLPLSGHRLAFSPDGRLLMVESDDRLLIFDRETGRIARQLRDPESLRPHDSCIDHMSFSPDGSLLATGCHADNDRKVKLWDMASGRLVSTLHVPGHGPLCPVFAPNSRRLVVACDRHVHFYTVTGRPACRVLAGQPFPVQAMSFDPSGERLATLSEHSPEQAGQPRGVVSTWATAANRRTFRHPFAGKGASVHPAITFLPNSNGIAWCTSAAVHRFDLDTKRESRREVGSLRTLARGLDGKGLWTAAGNEVRSWEGADLAPGSSWGNLSPEGLAGIYTVSAGRSWVIAGGRDGRFHVLSTAGVPLKCGVGPGGPVSAAALAADESFAVLGSQHGKLIVVSVPGGERLAELPAHDDAVEAVTFDAHAHFLATGGRDRSVRLWLRDGLTFRLVLSLRSLPAAVRELCLSADGSQLGMLLQGEAAVRLWDLAWLRQRCEDLGLGW
jgi:serine/threonine protein kinase/WD40 repeat protein